MATTTINIITEVHTAVNQKDIELALTEESWFKQDQQSSNDHTRMSFNSTAASSDNEDDQAAACDQTFESTGTDDKTEVSTSRTEDKTASNQVKEELWLGKRTFRETCISQRVLNKPTKRRRVEKFVAKQPKDKLAQILASRGFSKVNQFPSLGMPLQGMQQIRRQACQVMMNQRNEALYI